MARAKGAGDTIEAYSLFGATVKSLNSTLGINQSPTVVTVSVIEDRRSISISNREVVDISVGEFQFRGVVQSWSKVKVDIAGKNIYQVRITDTKPVLDSAQVVIGSAFNDDHTQAFDYGDNVMSVVFASVSEIADGVSYSAIKTVIESSTIKYGGQVYTVNLNFTLPDRGSSVEYSLKGRALSLLEFISQIANDHGLNWYVTTSTDNVISINMYGRSNITDMTVNQLAALHQNAIIRRHEGEENRDAIQKTVLLGGYRTYLNYVNGSLWQQFWGFDEFGNKRREPVYELEVMKQVVNNDFTSEDYTEQDVQKILSYANEFWGRKFIGLITPKKVVGSDGRSWVIPTSAAWDEQENVVYDQSAGPAFLRHNQVKFDRDGQTKFQTNDGRWITFVTLSLPGSRNASNVGTIFDNPDSLLSYQWDDELFSNTNSHINDDGDIFMKSSLEIIDDFGELEFWLERFIAYMLNLSNFTTVSSALVRFNIANSDDMALVVRLDFLRFVISHTSTLTSIADGTLIYTDAVKNDLSQDFHDEYFLLTLATPLRLKQLSQTAATGDEAEKDVVTKTRMQSFERAYIALLDQRETYGPWTNRANAVGRAEVIVDNSLTPWTFGYRGITTAVGDSLLERVARAKIKTVTDTTMDAKTAELEVAGYPAINIGDQLQTTGVITSINIVFAINGIRTTYKSLQYTTELSKHLRRQQDLLDSLRRQAAEFNNTTQPPKDEIRALKKELPEPSVDVDGEGTTRRALQTNLLGRINARLGGSSPKYNITPMAWVSDSFGSLSLVQNPKVFGDYLGVVNMGEPSTAPGRLPVGTDVNVSEFSVTDGGIVSYYIDTSAPNPPTFTATIVQQISSSQPTYKVTPLANGVQEINLLSGELLALNNVLNIGEPANFRGYLPNGTEVSVSWNENADGSFTPFVEQQLNLFKPIE